MQFKQRLGIVPQDLALYEDLTAQRNAEFFESLYGLKGAKLKKQVRKALEFTGLADKAKEKVRTFSGGMKRRSTSLVQSHTSLSYSSWTNPPWVCLRAL